MYNEMLAEFSMSTFALLLYIFMCFSLLMYIFLQSDNYLCFRTKGGTPSGNHSTFISCMKGLWKYLLIKKAH